MTIQQCKYVLKIAQCGSFNEAAKQLFVAQSSLSVSVKTLEQELSIKIFERSGNGVYLTKEGAEFTRYAQQIVQESDFILSRYTGTATSKRFCVTTQHYDFVADTFGKLLNETQDPNFHFSLQEMNTYDVIQSTQTAFCDVGILALKSSDAAVMERYLAKRSLLFTPILKTQPHVYLRKEHPLATAKSITPEQLKPFPCMAYEQGEHNSSFFTEEIVTTYADKQVEVSDRASLMNVLLATNCYTIGTGIMPSMLNLGRIISIPYESDDHYTVGYILRADRTMSPTTQRFIEILRSIVKTENGL